MYKDVVIRVSLLYLSLLLLFKPFEQENFNDRQEHRPQVENEIKLGKKQFGDFYCDKAVVELFHFFFADIKIVPLKLGFTTVKRKYIFLRCGCPFWYKL